ATVFVVAVADHTSSSRRSAARSRASKYAVIDAVLPNYMWSLPRLPSLPSSLFRHR
ncbi:hypothetical protein A2U01_0050542, partial [Trifolium medium]|nr:hypothetical protein [Trifolium medium]